MHIQQVIFCLSVSLSLCLSRSPTLSLLPSYWYSDAIYPLAELIASVKNESIECVIDLALNPSVCFPITSYYAS